MTQPLIPDEARRFILTSIPSVPHLEALLLLRAENARIWREDEVADRLYIAGSLAAACLRDLHAAGLLVAESNAYRYLPASLELKMVMDLVAEAYARQLVEVTTLIHSRPGKRAQRFADAFKWRKDS